MVELTACALGLDEDAGWQVGKGADSFPELSPRRRLAGDSHLFAGAIIELGVLQCAMNVGQTETAYAAGHSRDTSFQHTGSFALRRYDVEVTDIGRPHTKSALERVVVLSCTEGSLN